MHNFLIILQFTLVVGIVEIFFQVFDELLRRRVWRMTLHRFSTFIDNEFGEIPFDSIEERSSLLLLQILPQGMGILAVHVDFLEQIEIGFSIFHETLNFLGVSRLLVAKLIARECENSQTCKETLINSIQVFKRFTFFYFQRFFSFS